MSDLDIRAASLVGFLPDSIAQDEEILALSLALDPELRAVATAIDEAIVWPRIASASEDVCDALAWGFGLLRYEGWGTASLARKRTLLAQVVAIYRRRGTVWAVRRALDLLGEAYTLTEWHETGDDPFTYRLQIIVSDSGLLAEQVARARALVEAYGPARAYPAELSALIESSMDAHAVMAPSVGIDVTIPGV